MRIGHAVAVLKSMKPPRSRRRFCYSMAPTEQTRKCKKPPARRRRPGTSLPLPPPYPPSPPTRVTSSRSADFSSLASTRGTAAGPALPNRTSADEKLRRGTRAMGIPSARAPPSDGTVVIRRTPVHRVNRWKSLPRMKVEFAEGRRRGWEAYWYGKGGREP
ncbi:hypothetical protein LZ32DRAFT_219750 [Colletotrichum eremochloae]|nr:hypothetical protein LZ32DRAFT_219750 [Colletotrichum eremochloae]